MKRKGELSPSEVDRRWPHQIAVEIPPGHGLGIVPSTGPLSSLAPRGHGQELSVRVEGSLIFNDADMTVMAALDGRGLATSFEAQVAEHVSSGRLISVLEDWCPPYPGFFLYYPSRRQTPPALVALIEALRYRV